MLRMSGGRLLFVLSFFGVFFLAGCGNGVHTASPGPQGSLNSSLNGTYAFAISGTNLGLFSIAGSFQADGTGKITGGVVDINSPGTGVLRKNTPITGTYVVQPGGRTTATIIETAPDDLFTLDFVLVNTSSGVAVQLDNTAQGSGTIDLQNSSAFSLASLAGPLAFTLSGVDSAGNPESTAGLLNVDTSGNIVGGSVIDDNDSGTITLNQTIPVAALAVTAPTAGNGRGTLQIGTTNFAYYVVDANHLKLVEIDGGGNTPILAGDAFRQTSSAISGNFAFTLAGVTSAGSHVFTTGGILNTDGSGHIVNTTVTDVNNGGSFFQAVSTTGSYSVSGGRGTMTLTGGFGTINLAVYPSTGGLLMLEVDTSIVSRGTGLQQSGTLSNAALNGGFGLNITGVNVMHGTRIDGIAQFNTTGTGTLSGVIGISNGIIADALSLTGTYSISANGRGTGMLSTSGLGSFNVIYYMASGSRVLFMEQDTNQATVGLFAAQ